jgi:hypothetical protein
MLAQSDQTLYGCLRSRFLRKGLEDVARIQNERPSGSGEGQMTAVVEDWMGGAALLDVGLG